MLYVLFCGLFAKAQASQQWLNRWQRKRDERPPQRKETVTQRLGHHSRYGCNNNFKIVHEIGSRQRGGDIAFSTGVT